MDKLLTHDTTTVYTEPTMKGKRSKYSPELKTRFIQLVEKKIAEGQSQANAVKEVAAELAKTEKVAKNLNVSTFVFWKAQERGTYTRPSRKRVEGPFIVEPEKEAYRDQYKKSSIQDLGASNSMRLMVNGMTIEGSYEDILRAAKELKGD